MLKISEEQLERGFNVVRKAFSYKEATHYLWGQLNKQLDRIEPQLFELYQFRCAFESDSPAFFAEFLELSDYQRRSRNFYGLQIEMGTYPQMRKSQIEFHDLQIFAQASVLTLYPLFLANNSEFPFLLPEEIKTEERAFSQENLDLTGKTMHDINPEWFHWIHAILGNLIDPKIYTSAISLMVRLFLKGVQKTQLPHLEKMSDLEKELFFTEIEKTFFQKSKKG